MATNRKSISIVVAALLFAAAPARAQQIKLMSGPQGGSWYPLAGAIANIGDKAGDGCNGSMRGNWRPSPCDQGEHPSADGVQAELGEIVAGRKPGCRSLDEIFVFDSTGMALQDV